MTAQLAPNPIFKAFDNNGIPLFGGKLFSYEAGTTTPQPTYTDSTENQQNTNPVILNARGEAAVWLDPGLAYKLVLQDSLGNQIWSVDNIQGAQVTNQSLVPNTNDAYDLGSATNAWAQLYLGPNAATAYQADGNIIGYSGITPVETAKSVTPTNFGYLPGNVLRYGADPTGVAFSDTAIANAISVASGGTGFVYLPAGTYKVADQVIWKNHLKVYGDGNDVSILLSVYTGGDQNVILNPINSSTLCNSKFIDLQFQSGSTNSGFANFADTGSTYLYFERVRFAGNYYNLILDQTELWYLTDCLFDDIEANAYGLWIVNGSEHTPGANPNFTNRGFVKGTQFDGPSTATLVADDGGHQHTFVGNNFNGGGAQIRVNGCSDIHVAWNEMEACTNALEFHNTKAGGGTGSASGTCDVIGNLFSVAGNNVFDIVNSGCLSNLNLLNNAISCNNSSPYVNAVNIGQDIHAEGNVQIGTAPGFYLLNNHWSDGGSFTSAWSSVSGTAPTIGNGTIHSTYDRAGKEVTLRITLVAGSTTSFTGTRWTFSLPVTAGSESLNYIGSCLATVAGSFSNAGVPIIGPGDTVLSIPASGGTSYFGSAVPGTWANGDAIQLAIKFKAANWFG